jgi:hypothetical protein
MFNSKVALRTVMLVYSIYLPVNDLDDRS